MDKWMDLVDCCVGIRIGGRAIALVVEYGLVDGWISG